MTEKLIRVPTLDGSASCAATLTNPSLFCARHSSCKRCSSGDKHIWLKQDQLHDYLALKLVS